jgi:hypothetical protein
VYTKATARGRSSLRLSHKTRRTKTTKGLLAHVVEVCDSDKLMRANVIANEQGTGTPPQPQLHKQRTSAISHRGQIPRPRSAALTVPAMIKEQVRTRRFRKQTCDQVCAPPTQPGNSAKGVDRHMEVLPPLLAGRAQRGGGALLYAPPALREARRHVHDKQEAVAAVDGRAVCEPKWQCKRRTHLIQQPGGLVRGQLPHGRRFPVCNGEVNPNPQDALGAQSEVDAEVGSGFIDHDGVGLHREEIRRQLQQGHCRGERGHRAHPRPAGQVQGAHGGGLGEGLAY